MELLAERATQGLSPADEAELARLLRRHPQIDADGFDYAAALAMLALWDQSEPGMPATLSDRLEAGADRFVDSLSPGMAGAGDGGGRAAARRARWWRRGLGGGLAAAATLAVAALAWWGADAPPEPTAPAPEPPMAQQERDQDERSPSPSTGSAGIEKPLEDFASMLAGYADRVVLTFRAIEEAVASMDAQGQVIWSNEAQHGYARLHGLPPNDPKQQQYQLWIYDQARQEQLPISGGVFDVSADPTRPGEVIIPIDPTLRVFEPTHFAVTLEPRGGSVVSHGQPLLATNEPEAETPSP